MDSSTRHQCQIYAGAPQHSLPTLASTIRKKLRQEFRCLYLNTPAMVESMRATLAGMGVDVSGEVERGGIIFSSEPVYAANEKFEVDPMLHQLDRAVEDALKSGFKGLWASGDMTWEFGPKKDFSKLLEYEYKLEKLFRRRPELCGVCQYHVETLPADVSRAALLAHQTIFVNETVFRLNRYYMSPDRPGVGAPSDRELDEMIGALCNLAP